MFAQNVKFFSIYIGVFGSFGTEGRNVAQVFPDHQMSLLTLEPHCLVPVHREYLMLGGNNSRRHSIITRFSFGKVLTNFSCKIVL